MAAQEQCGDAQRIVASHSGPPVDRDRHQDGASNPQSSNFLNNDEQLVRNRRTTPRDSFADEIRTARHMSGGRSLENGAEHHDPWAPISNDVAIITRIALNISLVGVILYVLCCLSLKAADGLATWCESLIEKHRSLSEFVKGDRPQGDQTSR